MNRLRRWSVFCTFLILAVGFAPAGDDPPPAAKAAGEKWLVDRALTVTPQPEPSPALKYQLLPMATDLKEGNAVPIYLRLIHEQNDEARRFLMETPLKWAEMPMDRVPQDEVNKYLDRTGRFLQQLDYGARRTSADWSYTLEQPDPISILLPDTQQMRGYAAMLVLRARVQVARGDYAGAARSFETGFAFSRHVADGPFLINGLVGLAIANQMLDRIPEWVERPGSPNLYWALTALPRPFVDMRRQFDIEQRVVEWQFPDLRAEELNRPKSAADWATALKRFRTELKRVYPMAKGDENIELTDPNQPAEQSPALPAARAHAMQRLGLPAAEVAAMPAGRVLLLYIHGTYAVHRDDLFKAVYLPYPEARRRFAAAADRLAAATGTEGTRLARLFLPANGKALAATNRLDRKVAALRAVEALRLHAAAHDGQLPDSLDQVTVVPVPTDPGTGKPFEYTRDGATATLTGRIPGEPLETTGLRYRVTLKSK